MKRSEFKKKYNEVADKAWKDFAEIDFDDEDIKNSDMPNNYKSLLTTYNKSMQFTNFFVFRLLEAFVPLEDD